MHLVLYFGNFGTNWRWLFSTVELTLLMEGLSSGSGTKIKEYTIEPEKELYDDMETADQDKDYIKLCTQGQPLIAKPVSRQSTLSRISRQGTLGKNSLADHIVNLFDSITDKSETGGVGSVLFSTMGSVFNAAEEPLLEDERSDEEAGDSDYASDHSSNADEPDSENGLRSPLLSVQPTVINAGVVQDIGGESAMDIGGGWHLAYRLATDDEGKKEELKRIYIQTTSAPASQAVSLVSTRGDVIVPESGEAVHSVALVSQAALHFKDNKGQDNKPTEAGPTWSDLCEPGVKHALFVGMGLLILQQVHYLLPEPIVVCDQIDNLLSFVSVLWHKWGHLLHPSALGASRSSATPCKYWH